MEEEEEEEEEAVFISVVNTNEDPPRLAGKGGQGTGRTAYGIRAQNQGHGENQVQDASGQGKARQEHKSHELYAHAGQRRQEGQGRQNLRREPPGIPKHTQPSDTDVRNAMGDRVLGGNLQGF